MLFHLIVGIAVTAVFVLLLNYVQKAGIKVSIWAWALTILGLAYSIFVLEVIYGFATEGEPQAALVMGLITGIVAVVWWVLLGRFAFTKKAA